MNICKKNKFVVYSFSKHGILIKEADERRAPCAQYTGSSKLYGNKWNTRHQKIDTKRYNVTGCLVAGEDLADV